MSFLTPLFLIALAGLAGPILLHLTRQERGRPVRFPSLMFLERIPFQEKSRRRIRHWALLIVRLAALALLVAAFARPFVREGRLASVGGAAAEEVVVMLDRSWSMEMGDNWAEAVSRARSVVGALRPRDRASLIVFSETPTLLHRSIGEPARILAALDTLSTTSLATRLAPAIKLAASTLAASNLPRQRVVVISDFQRPAWRPDPDAVLPEGVVVESVVIGGDESANLALADLELGRQGAGGRERVTVGARLVNTGEAPVGAEVVLSIDETEIETAAVTVPGGGAAPVAFEAFTLTAPFTHGEVRIAAPADAGLEQDNTLHFVASPGGDLDVVVVDPLGPGDSNLYLRGALGIAEGSGFAARVVRSVPGNEALAGAEVVILNGGAFPGGGAGDRLRAFVEDGGGLLFVLGERSTVPAVHADFLPAAVGRVVEGSGERHLGHVGLRPRHLRGVPRAPLPATFRRPCSTARGRSPKPTARCSPASTTVRPPWSRAAADADACLSGPPAWTASGTTFRCSRCISHSCTASRATWAAAASSPRGTWPGRRSIWARLPRPRARGRSPRARWRWSPEAGRCRSTRREVWD